MAGELLTTTKTMHHIHRLHDQMVLDFKKARKRFELYEKFYFSLSNKAKRYLRGKSKEYRRCLIDIQELILPGVRRICPTCRIQCCRLYAPELSVYIAGSVGGFDLVDYLLIRCDKIIPEPCYENAEKNLCPFWAEGCILPVDCRSFLCIQFFCDSLKEELDMEPISKSLEKIQAVLNSFSIGACMV